MNEQDAKIEALRKKVNRRYWLFSLGFVISALGSGATIAMYNVYLGIACILAEIMYFCYVNMVNTGAARIRLQNAMQYTRQINAQTKEIIDSPESSHGQYL